MNDLTGRRILVTGAASGIGAATARRCAAAGARVIAADRVDPKDTSGLADGHEHVVLDVANAERVAEVVAELGQIDGLVNAAGISIPGGIAQLDTAAWQKILDVNLTGTMLVCKQVTEHLLSSQRQGSIVNVSSAYGLTGGPGNISYNVSKSGVWQLTRCMAADLGGYGIRVNAVAPGYIETPMTDMLKNAGPFRDQFIAMHLLKRPGKSEEVAAAINFLLSDDAAYITGTNLPVDGGFTAAHVPNLGM